MKPKLYNIEKQMYEFPKSGVLYLYHDSRNGYICRCTVDSNNIQFKDEMEYLNEEDYINAVNSFYKESKDIINNIL